MLRLRFGLEDGRPRTLEEVGKEFNVTRERIRQIEAKALRKLRHPSRSKKLRDFLDLIGAPRACAAGGRGLRAPAVQPAPAHRIQANGEGFRVSASPEPSFFAGGASFGER